MSEPGKTVMVVDDEMALASLMGLSLESAGYRVTVARSGAEAIGLAAGNCPDLLVTDLHMPGLGGAETLREMRRLQPDLPAIVISGVTSEEMHAESPEADTFLKKPFSIRALLSAAQELLARL